MVTYVHVGSYSSNAIGPERHAIAEGYKFVVCLGGEISV